MVVSVLIIGLGGLGGCEGLIVQILVGFCLLLICWLNLFNEDGWIVVVLGIGVGIGVIFVVLLGGVVLGVLIFYCDDFDYCNLLLGFIVLGIVYVVFGVFLGFDLLFGYIDVEYCFEKVWLLLWFVVIGLIVVVVGYLYV